MKPFWQSKTIRGLIVAAVGFLLTWAQHKGWLQFNDAQLLTDLFDYVGEVLGLGGLAFSAYGRAKTNGEAIGFKKSE